MRATRRWCVLELCCCCCCCCCCCWCVCAGTWWWLSTHMAAARDFGFACAFSITTPPPPPPPQPQPQPPQTPLGRHLSSLPVDVRVGKMLLYGAMFRCVDPVLTVAAALSGRSPFLSPMDKRDEANESKRKFARGNSDHLTVVHAYDEWWKARRRGDDRCVLLSCARFGHSLLFSGTL